MDRVRLLQDGRLSTVKTMDDNHDEVALLSREELPSYAASDTDRMRCHAWLRMQGASFFLVHFTQVAESPHALEENQKTSFGDVVGEAPIPHQSIEDGSSAPVTCDASAPIVRQFQPRVIPSKESWAAARKEMTELEQEIGRQQREELEKPGDPDPKAEQPKAWRNYGDEDGWDDA